MYLICLAMIPLALLIACPMTWLVRQAGLRLGHLDQPGGRKAHQRAVPATGGVAIVAAVLGPMAVGLAVAWWAPQGWWAAVAPAAVEHLPGIHQQTPMALTLLISLGALHIMGLIDDRRALGPLAKLAVQLIAAGAMVGLMNVRLLELLGTYLGWPGVVMSIALTVLWFIIITNAMNFLDNMDGLAGGVGLICAAVFMAAALLGGQWFVAATLGLLVGALLGFLVFNFPPASIFMGDGGSLVVGFLLAFCSLRLTYVDESLGEQAGGWWVLFTPLVVLAIPLYDLTSVTLIRLAQGRSPLVGDTQHFSHRLVRKGLSRPAAVIVIYACTLATALGGVLLGQVDRAWHAWLIFSQALAVLVVLALLERTHRHRDDRS